MSAHTTTYVAWQHHETGLELRVADRRVPVPQLITDLLLSAGGYGLTDDPALDLLRLEQDLRHYACHLASETQHAADEVAFARDEITLADAEHGRTGRRNRRTASTHLANAATTHTRCVDRHKIAQSWITALRTFITNAAVPDGLLAEAAAGWQRSPEVPSFVTVFDTERAFLDADPRRGTSASWGAPILAGTHFGNLWRRDGDDDDLEAAPLPRSGPWRLSYLPRTGEVYASRRSGRQPEQIWLLGSGLHEREPTVTLLIELETHMREPNSLILAAHTIHKEIRTPGHQRN